MSLKLLANSIVRRRMLITSSRTRPAWLAWLMLSSFLVGILPLETILAQMTLPSFTSARSVTSLPNAGASPPLNKPLHGLNLDVSNGWSEETGYIPVQFFLHRVAASSSDTTVTIHLRTLDYYRYYGVFGSGDVLGTHVWQDVEIPAGEMQAEATISLLQMSQGGFSWEVFVDGKLAEELAGDQSYYYGYGNSTNSGLANILLVATPSNAQTIVDLALSMNPGFAQPIIDEIVDRGKRNAWQGLTQVEAGMKQLTPAEFPQRAIDYNSLDIIYVTADELQQLTQQKVAWRAMKEWLASGGNIWIVGVGDKWDRLPEVDKAFGFAAKPEDPKTRGWFALESDREKEIASAAWTALEVDHDLRAAALLAQQTSQPPNTPGATVTVPSPDQTLQIPPPAMLSHGFLLGQINVFAADQPFAENPTYGGPGMSLTRRFPINSLLGWRESWNTRHGMVLGGENEGFWNWLVPGVGLAPVTMFQVLITLFVLAIGPLNFVLLRRWKRPYFMLVTVPLAAGVITAGLFAYAFLTDGLSTRVRVRSFTEIDQGKGLAATWARLSYYSALAPSDGLRIPKDTILLPIEPEERNPYYGVAREPYLETHWGRDQHLTGDWLPSRTPVQYTMIRARQSPVRLEVKATPQGVSVENKLQATLLQLVVCGEDGKFYAGSQISPGASATLAEVNFPQAKGKLHEHLLLVAPEFPPGWAQSHYTTYSPLGEWRQTHESTMGSSDVQNSLLEVALERINTSEPDSTDSIYARGRYIAIVDKSPEVPLGLPELEQQSSVHVVTGTWK